MTIYNINLGIGWASSGVEYAQAYRAGVFRKLNLSSKFIFTDKRMARFCVSSFLTKISLSPVIWWMRIRTWFNMLSMFLKET